MDLEEKIYKKEEFIKSIEEAIKEIVDNLKLDNNRNIMKFSCHFNTKTLMTKNQNNIDYYEIYVELKEIKKIVDPICFEKKLEQNNINYSYGEKDNILRFEVTLENYLLLENYLEKEELLKRVKEEVTIEKTILEFQKKKKEKPFSRIRRLFR